MNEPEMCIVCEKEECECVDPQERFVCFNCE